MTERKLAPSSILMLVLASTALSGCVAAAIPALAGSAILSGRADSDKDAKQTVEVAAMPAPTAAAAPKAAQSSAMVQPSAAPSEAPAPVPAPALAAAQTDQDDFAKFVRYSRAVALAARDSGAPLSAVLSDPIALDGQRRRCKADEQSVALIDLDPKGGIFAPPANPNRQAGLALGLAVLREAGVVIGWISDLLVEETGALRTALEQSGLDPRGEDIIALRDGTDNRKQLRKDNLAANACIIAIAGDESADFDERFRYLRNPEAGAALEPIIGDGWFLVEPIFPIQGPQGQ